MKTEKQIREEIEQYKKLIKEGYSVLPDTNVLVSYMHILEWVIDEWEAK